LDKAKIPHRAFGLVDWPTRDYRHEHPVSDAIFHVYAGQFAYDKTELNPAVESRDEGSPDWVREKVTFDAAYARERVIALLFLPGDL
jgi:hypothetical protein